MNFWTYLLKLNKIHQIFGKNEFTDYFGNAKTKFWITVEMREKTALGPPSPGPSKPVEIEGKLLQYVDLLDKLEEVKKSQFFSTALSSHLKHRFTQRTIA
jgi:hypothetical protein